jgi:hypothetical protein
MSAISWDPEYPYQIIVYKSLDEEDLPVRWIVRVFAGVAGADMGCRDPVARQGKLYELVHIPHNKHV